MADQAAENEKHKHKKLQEMKANPETLHDCDGNKSMFYTPNREVWAAAIREVCSDAEEKIIHVFSGPEGTIKLHPNGRCVMISKQQGAQFNNKFQQLKSKVAEKRGNK